MVTEGGVRKFEQNPELKDFLLSTGDLVLVEAGPGDCIWGIGLGQDNSKAQNPETWRGQNLLGFALMDVRSTLFNQQISDWVKQLKPIVNKFLKKPTKVAEVTATEVIKLSF